LTDLSLKKEQDQIQMQIKMFEALHSEFEEMQSESSDAASIYKRKMADMTAVREKKLENNR
jgi:hypothetical protein